MLADYPQLGKKSIDIHHSYLKYPHSKHIIYYRQIGDQLIGIVRILQERMDPDSQF